MPAKKHTSNSKISIRKTKVLCQELYSFLNQCKDPVISSRINCTSSWIIILCDNVCGRLIKREWLTMSPSKRIYFQERITESKKAYQNQSILLQNFSPLSHILCKTLEFESETLNLDFEMQNSDHGNLTLRQAATSEINRFWTRTHNLKLHHGTTEPVNLVQRVQSDTKPL